MPGFLNNEIKEDRFSIDNRGFSLTELVVVMVIFLTVMMITSSSFKTIVNHSSQQSKSAETQIEGIVGLEVLRADLEQSGFGLPWTFQTPITYAEANLGTSMPAANYWLGGADPDSPEYFNDAGSPGDPPRAILSGNTKFNLDAANVGSKYLVVKSTTTAINDTAKKWTNFWINTGGVKVPPRFWDDTAKNLTAEERVIVIKNNMLTTPPSRQLMAPAATRFSTRFSNYTAITQPLREGDTYQIYGVAPPASTQPELVRMPFNRSDYYVKIPSNMPGGCAPNTGVLYKTNINQTIGASGGGYASEMPILDCVADMQIVYGISAVGSSEVTLHDDTTEYMTMVNASTQKARAIRDRLKEIRVYLLVQDGRKDLMYSYPSNTVAVGENLRGVFKGRTFDLAALIGSGWQHYRWKVYTIVVRPKNLIQ